MTSADWQPWRTDCRTCAFLRYGCLCTNGGLAPCDPEAVLYCGDHEEIGAEPEKPALLLTARPREWTD